MNTGRLICVVGANLRGIDEVLAGRGKRGPELWDGRAAVRIAEDLASWLRSRAG